MYMVYYTQTVVRRWKGVEIMSRAHAEFVIYMVNEIANSLNRYPSKVYRVLNQTGCIQKYLIPFYDVLHTMSSESVAEDVLEYVRAQGGSL